MRHWTFVRKQNVRLMRQKLLDVIQLAWQSFNPQNCADYLESMKNKEVSREDKIKARLLYNQQQTTQ